MRLQTFRGDLPFLLYLRAQKTECFAFSFELITIIIFVSQSNENAMHLEHRRLDPTLEVNLGFTPARNRRVSAVVVDAECE
jgi:hypothetical protein